MRCGKGRVAVASNVLELLPDRDEGVAGSAWALGGYLVEVAAKTSVSVVVAVAVGWCVQLLVRRAFGALTGQTSQARTA